MDAINLLEKAGLVDALWSPRVVGELNDVQVKVARIHGDFVWHDHEDTDELLAWRPAAPKKKPAKVPARLADQLLGAADTPPCPLATSLTNLLAASR